VRRSGGAQGQHLLARRGCWPCGPGAPPAPGRKAPPCAPWLRYG